MSVSPAWISAAAGDLVLEPLEGAGEIALLLELPPPLVAQFVQPLKRGLRIAERVVDGDSVKRLEAAGRLRILAAARVDLGIELLESAGKVARLLELAPPLVAQRRQTFQSAVRILQRVADRDAIGPDLPTCPNRHGILPCWRPIIGPAQRPCGIGL